MILDLSEKLDFHNVLIKPKRSVLESRSQVNLVRQFKPKYGKPFSGIGIIASNMLTGNFTMLEALSKYQCFTAIAKHHNNKWKEALENDIDKDFINKVTYGIYTIGMNYNELETLYNFSIDVFHKYGKEVLDSIKICVDIANGYTQKFASFIKAVRYQFKNNIIIAGNICTPEMVHELIINGADYCKVGIGPGSQCRTRIKTGIGYPQVSACIDCADSAHGLGGGIILDGGMRNAGDIAKSFCANSDLVMIGGMFSGTDECDGEIITKYFESNEVEWNKETGQYNKKIIEKKYKLFYGMSSDYAQVQHFGGIKEYRTSEGNVEEIECKGSVEIIIKDILGGLRSCGTYIGASDIKDFSKCATLIKVPRVHDRF